MGGACEAINGGCCTCMVSLLVLLSLNPVVLSVVIMTELREDMDPMEIVKLIEEEENDGGDILDELNEQEVKEIYSGLSKEDQRRF